MDNKLTILQQNTDFIVLLTTISKKKTKIILQVDVLVLNYYSI